MGRAARSARTLRRRVIGDRTLGGRETLTQVIALSTSVLGTEGRRET
jgi:hypothetical protein